MLYYNCQRAKSIKQLIITGSTHDPKKIHTNASMYKSKGAHKMTTYTLNKEFNGIEITFDSKPAAEIRDTLKANGFRWHKMKGLWYAKQTEEREKLAQQLAGGEKVEAKKAPEKAEPANKFGVKVGDLFYTSWGYDQTNNDFFQVVELVGKTSVRVREVCLQVVNREAVSGLAEDITIKTTREMLPPVKHSTFIKDNERGDLKRLKSYAADGVSRPQFYLTSFADAWKVEADEMTVYESWTH